MRFFSRQQQPDFSVAYIDIMNMSGPKNHRYSCRNGRKNHGFIYTVRGSMRYDFLNETPAQLFTIPGTLLYIPKDCAYSTTYLENDTEHKTVQFDLLTGTLPEYLSAPRIIPLPNTEGILDAFFRHQGTHLFYRLSCLHHLLWQIDICCSGLPVKYKRLLPAITDLSDHCEESHPISHYAELCGMSEVNFRRLFREYTGKSPIEYRNDQRLENARSRIQSGEYSVSEAAETVGFTNLSFFTRLYKQKYGHTPKQT